MNSAFGDTYAAMSDDELIGLASQKDSLLPVAQETLTVEMQKRELDESAVANHRLADEEATQREKQQAKTAKAARSRRRIENLKRLGILVAAAIATDWLISKLLGLPTEAIAALTDVSVYAATGLFFATLAVGGDWWTLKRSLGLAVGLSVCLSAWVIYTFVRMHPH